MYAKKYYKQLQEDGIARTDAVLILYIENCKMLVSNMPSMLRNYIDYNYSSEYFNLQRVRNQNALSENVESMLKLIRKSIYEYEQLPSWKKGVVQQNISSLIDMLFDPVLPSDSFIFKMFFYIPLSVCLWIFGITNSFVGSEMLLLVIFIIGRILYGKIKLKMMNIILLQSESPIFLKIISMRIIGIVLYTYMILLPIWSSYILLFPRYEHIYLLHAFGYRYDNVTALQSFYSSYTPIDSHWYIIVLFCIVVVASNILSKTDYIVNSMATSDMQRRMFKENQKDYILDQIESQINGEFVDYSLSNDLEPYTDLVVNRVFSVLSRLAYLIPVGIVLDARILAVIIIITLTYLVKNICDIFEARSVLKKNGFKLRF